ncbi:PREDICTED: uncharacterized protein LOC108610150 [Drosophila arizonae]|uniref:Uncharacterized protein LOC108610150 n=1 Tax=Drosophila arizonae TaxID=7263 RepID=A0ABM1NRH1_DROAR|nr:PREDICTED: uncharacterized protein LOC108610150 [Drosophila arizonae]
MQIIYLLLFCAFSYCAAAQRRYYYNYPQWRAPPSVYNQNPQGTRHSRQSSSTSNNNNNNKSELGSVNPKFAGAGNQELDELSSDVGNDRSLLLKKKLKRLYRPYAAAAAASYGYGSYGYGSYGRPCTPFGRDAAGQKDPAEQGRFLFDLNVYNVYPGAGGCRGYGGGLGGLGGGLLSDPVPPPPVPVPVPVPVRPYAPLATWLSLFAPGILQNSLAATVPGVPYADQLPVRPASASNDPQSDPAVDPNYNPVPVRRPVPNRVYFDSAGAPPVTPGQLVGGVSTTINGIIQQLTGQVQPVYQTGVYRARSDRSSYG